MTIGDHVWAIILSFNVVHIYTNEAPCRKKSISIF